MCSHAAQYNGIKRFARRLPYVLWFNVVIFIMIVLTLAAWFLDLGALAHWAQEHWFFWASA